MTTLEAVPTEPTINIPADTSKSRLPRSTPKTDIDDVTTAGERIEAFWRKHPDGNILTEVEHREVGEVTIYQARAFVRKAADSTTPDATAHATRSTADSSEIAGEYPQETAETAAVSRALRNLGILATPKKTRKPKEKA